MRGNHNQWAILAILAIARILRDWPKAFPVLLLSSLVSLWPPAVVSAPKSPCQVVRWPGSPFLVMASFSCKRRSAVEALSLVFVWETLHLIFAMPSVTY